jgi:C-terminal processing protease CtpA/Prc
MIKRIVLSALTILTLLFTGCINDTLITPNNEINDFVWKGMNSWYNWQPNVDDLADSKDDNNVAYTSFLNSYDEPKDLFQGLLYDHPNTDRFSWFVEDYVVQNNQFQGISLSFGLRLKGVTLSDDDNSTDDDAILYVRYVAPDSPASNAGINRGDIINALDGTVLKDSNYDAVTSKLGNETVTFSFVSESAGTLTFIEDKTITRAEITDNPVHFKKVFNDINGKKVGYLVYNGFRSSYNDELNEAFAFFKTENIDELVLDLRLNGGGSVLTSSYLASMMYATAGTDIFAELRFNSKHTNQNGTYEFDNTLNVYNVNGDKTGTEVINRLNGLSRLYVLASSSTASASEMIINGLKAFIPVKVTGTTTFGKNVGSITLYDSPSSDYTDESTASKSHLNAMQPIVFQIYNKLGQSDYTQGFVPDIEVKEYQFWNNILPFGDENEVVLKAALDDIRGVSAKSLPSTLYKNMKELEVLQLEKRFDKEMYIDHDFFENNR